MIDPAHLSNNGPELTGQGHPGNGAIPLPRWRRWAVLVIFLGIVVGWPVFALTTGPTSPADLEDLVADSRLWLYITTGLILWLVFALVWIGQKLGRRPLTELGFTEPRLLDPVIGFVFLIVANIVLHMTAWVLQTVVGMTPPDESVRMILPQIPIERIGWIALSITAGICEETCFRGFVLLRGTEYLKGRWSAVLISSVAFGSGHLYQGDTGALLIFLYGVMFCGLRLWQGSLWPGIWAHIWQDLGAMALGPMAGS